MPEIITRKAAIERGLKRYFTGKPCANGHRSSRSANSGICLECHRLSQQRSYSRHRDKCGAKEVCAARRRRYEKNAQKIRDQSRPRSRERMRRIHDLIAVLRKEMPELLKEFGL